MYFAHLSYSPKDKSYFVLLETHVSLFLNFDVLLTVHLCVILIINELNAQINIFIKVIVPILNKVHGSNGDFEDNCDKLTPSETNLSK